VDELKRRGRKPATIEIAARKAGHFIRLWGGGMPLSQITSSRVADYIRTREGEGGKHGKRVRPLTIRRELDVLRGTLKLAFHRGRLARPVEQIMPLEYSPRYEPRRRWLTEEDAHKIAAALAPRRRAWFALAIGAGARRSEVIAITRKDVDLRRDIVRVAGTKTTGARADVPITVLQRPWIDVALEHGHSDGRICDSWPNVSRDLAAACKRAKVARCTPNDLRRTLGYWLRHAGVEPHLIGRVLRHRDSTMAELVYAEGDVSAIQALLEQRLKPVRNSVRNSVPLQRHQRHQRQRGSRK
jgi:integrase